MADHEDTSRDKARAEGKDYVLHEYAQFNAYFLECVHCDWIEYMPTKNWMEDLDMTRSVYNHTVDNHRSGK